MAQLGDLAFYYSGGAANATPELSIGGAISSELVLSQSAVAVTSDISGVVVNEAFGNNEGTGELKWDLATGTLSWKSPTGGTFNGVVVTADGDLTIGDPSGYVIVTITWALLSVASSIQQAYTITHEDAKVFDDITAAQSLAGHVEYRCIYLQNDSAGTISAVKLWIKQQPLGADTLKIGLENVGVVPATIANDTTAPVGVSFSAPSTYDGALALDGDGNLDAGEFVAIWEERTVLAGNNVRTLNDASQIAVAASI